MTQEEILDKEYEAFMKYGIDNKPLSNAKEAVFTIDMKSVGVRLKQELEQFKGQSKH